MTSKEIKTCPALLECLPALKCFKCEGTTERDPQDRARVAVSQKATGRSPAGGRQRYPQRQRERGKGGWRGRGATGGRQRDTQWEWVSHSHLALQTAQQTYTSHNTKTGRINLRHHAKGLQIWVWCHWRKRGKGEEEGGGRTHRSRESVTPIWS